MTEANGIPYEGWSELSMRRQFWYLTQRINYQNNVGTETLHRERNELLTEYQKRHPLLPGIPMSKNGCEDLLP